jgi:hypothetical protein
MIADQKLPEIRDQRYKTLSSPLLLRTDKALAGATSLSGGLCHKTSRIRNLQEIDRFCSKLVFSVSHKHGSLLWNLHFTNSKCFYSTVP